MLRRIIEYFLIACLVVLCTGAPLIAQNLLTLPSWTTATRVGNTPGAIGFNTQTNLPEFLDTTDTWQSLSPGAGLQIGAPVAGGIPGNCLYINGSVLGNQTCSSGTVTSVTDNGGSTLTFSPTSGAVLGGCTTATTLQVGCIKPDGTTLVMSGSTMSVVGLPPPFSITAGCGNAASGGAITPSNPAGTINSVFLETRAVTSYPDTLLVGDCGGVVVFRSGSNVVENLPLAGSTGFIQNYGVTYCNAGAGTVTLTPASGTIGKLSSYVLAAGTEAARTCVAIYSGTYSGAAGAFVSSDWGFVTGQSNTFNSGILVATTLQQTTAYSAAGTPLPTCNSGAKGSFAWVSDATSPTFLATYTSGGAVNSPVFCNGTNWVTH